MAIAGSASKALVLGLEPSAAGVGGMGFSSVRIVEMVIVRIRWMTWGVPLAERVELPSR